MLADRDGTLHYVASSSERMRLIELFELQHDEGPCLDAFRDGVAVHSSLLGDDARRAGRASHPTRSEVGFASVSALPMRLRNEVIGALNLFSTTSTPLADEDQQVAQALADIATIGILQERALNDARVVASQLEAALRVTHRDRTGQGHRRRTQHTSPSTTRSRMLRTYARTHNRLLSQIAHDVIDGTLATDALDRPQDSRRVAISPTTASVSREASASTGRCRWPSNTARVTAVDPNRSRTPSSAVSSAPPLAAIERQRELHDIVVVEVARPRCRRA